nr:flagellar biosynthetic protein FliO [Nitrospinaceae bacterium]NIR53874.1 flagellar biosynthetic protein FliO [Nitrospinaceae bacterium]NIS84288.1 flagellar biosynthetic protein FliO [Nitrospinaceae bacterium]NIT81095.1 flagellar biosynthetic protein FliO [Nitrospinaceae bacterium]NIU43377.1 flagellar biosynthetic protein FliO [Nitrospinaceae bacterium]
KTIQVLGTGFLGPRKNIAIVEVAGEVLVLGVSNDNISLLATIREKDRIEQIKNEGNGGSFWSSAKSTGSSPDRSSLSPRTIQAFAKYLQEYSSTRVGREKSPSQVAAEIRKNIGKLKTV